MKVAVTAQGPEPTSTVDLRFGRAKCFVVADVDSGRHEAFDNVQNFNAVHGAGIQAAQKVVGLGVNAVITGNVGPNAFRALASADTKVFLVKGGTVQEALDRFNAGDLKEVNEATVEGHW
jgi:predicted Fe-Mo cluster-binding NifX family protein